MLLKTFQKNRSKDPTLVRLLMRQSLTVLVLVVACIGIWLLATAPGGSPEWGCLVIAFLSAIIIRKVTGTFAFWQRWPVMREVIDWRRVDELIEQSETRAGQLPRDHER